MVDNGHQDKVKVGVSVFISEAGQLGFQSTSQNQFTILGVLIAGIIFIGCRLLGIHKTESLIEVPKLQL